MEKLTTGPSVSAFMSQPKTFSFFNWLNSQKPNDELEKWIHQTIPAVKTVAPSHSTAK